MNISIIGAGAIGTALARNFARKGIEVMIANRSGLQSLRTLEQSLSPFVRAVTPADALNADMIFLAVNWSQAPEVLAQQTNWQGKILVDATNAVQIPSFTAVDLQGKASSEVIASLVPGAKVVKAFNHLLAKVLESGPITPEGRRVLFISGPDESAKQSVSEIISQLEFVPVDLGGTEQGRLTQFPGGPLSVINLIQQA